MRYDWAWQQRPASSRGVYERRVNARLKADISARPWAAGRRLSFSHTGCRRSIIIRLDQYKVQNEIK